MSSRRPGHKALLIAIVVSTAMPPLIFAFRTFASAWLVFPSPLLQPAPPGVTSHRLAAAAALTPDNGTYAIFLARDAQNSFRISWASAEAAEHGRRALEWANRATRLVATNAYAHRLVGSIALDLAQHPTVTPTEKKELLDQGLSAMEAALALSSNSPLVQEQVGIELLRSWRTLDESGHNLVVNTLETATVLDWSFLVPALSAVWAHVENDQSLAVLSAITPSTPEGRLELARFLELQSDVPATAGDRSIELATAALGEYEQAVELSGFAAPAVADWARAYRRISDADGSAFLVSARGLLDTSPERSEAWLALALAEKAVGNLDGELVAVNKAVALAGNDPEPKVRALRQQADLLLERSLHEDALAAYLLLAALQPGEAYPILQQGVCLEALGRRDEALERYVRAVRMSPRTRWIRETLARAYARQYEYLDAIQQWRTIATRDRQDPEAYAEIARLYAQLGIFDEAVSYYNEAIQRAPDDTGLRAEMDGLLRRFQLPR